MNIDVGTEADTNTDDVRSDHTTGLGSAQVQLDAIGRAKSILKAQNGDYGTAYSSA